MRALELCYCYDPGRPQKDGATGGMAAHCRLSPPRRMATKDGINVERARAMWALLSHFQISEAGAGERQVAIVPCAMMSNLSRATSLGAMWDAGSESSNASKIAKGVVAGGRRQSTKQPSCEGALGLPPAFDLSHFDQRPELMGGAAASHAAPANPGQGKARSDVHRAEGLQFEIGGRSGDASAGKRPFAVRRSPVARRMGAKRYAHSRLESGAQQILMPSRSLAWIDQRPAGNAAEECAWGRECVAPVQDQPSWR